MFDLSPDCPAADVQPPQNADHSFAGRDATQGSCHRPPNGPPCGRKRVGECGREAQQQTGRSQAANGNDSQDPGLGLGGREGQHRPQTASSRSEGRSVGEDGREAPQPTDGAQRASGPCEDR